MSDWKKRLIGEALVALLQRTSSHHRPRQVALAAALGCACGLLPKSGLLFPLGLCVLFCLPIHATVCVVGVFITSVIAAWLQPWQGQIGHMLMQTVLISRWVQQLDGLPLIPWLRLHHTVTSGALAISAVAMPPIYWMVQRWMIQLQAIELAKQFEMQRRSQPQPTPRPIQPQVQLQLVAPGADSSLPVRVAASQDAQLRPPQIAPDVSPRPLAAGLNTQVQPAPAAAPTIDSIQALEELLEQALSEHSSSLGTDAVLARATRAAQLIDEILAIYDDETASTSPSADQAACAQSEPEQAVPPQSTTLSSAPADRSQLDNSNAATPPSVDEVNQRFSTWQPRAPGSLAFEAYDTKISFLHRTDHRGAASAAPNVQPHLETVSIPTSMTTNQSVSSPTAHVPVIVPPAPKRAIGTVTTQSSVSAAHEVATRNVEIRHEEALRHLLNHLQTLKEKV
ncbi:MAG: hypothetical protein KF752_01675 [Pirellulaceae bacterium]|nr:hypothetical protein [Pirellulaceae bacterium]